MSTLFFQQSTRRHRGSRHRRSRQRRHLVQGREARELARRVQEDEGGPYLGHLTFSSSSQVEHISLADLLLPSSDYSSPSRAESSSTASSGVSRVSSISHLLSALHLLSVFSLLAQRLVSSRLISIVSHALVVSHHRDGSEEKSLSDGTTLFRKASQLDTSILTI
jgi:hypothetical protein